MKNLNWPSLMVSTDSSHRFVTDEQIELWTNRKNRNALIIQLHYSTVSGIEGTNQFTYDGSSPITIQITSSAIGAAEKDHSHEGNISEDKFNTNMSKKADKVYLTDESLNTLYIPGFYNAGDSNTCAGKPSGVTRFGLLVVNCVQTTPTSVGDVNRNGAFAQILIDPIHRKAYIRFSNIGALSFWNEINLTALSE